VKESTLGRIPKSEVHGIALSKDEIRSEMMKVVYERCAGLDVHKKTVVACRSIIDDDLERHAQETRTFNTMTKDILLLSDWLREGSITHVAMESTGSYWKPIFNILESEFEVILVNARHIKHVPGRKTDVKDAV
jgi:transposase